MPPVLQPQDERVEDIMRRLDAPNFPSEVLTTVRDKHAYLYDESIAKLATLTTAQLTERLTFAAKMSTNTDVGWFITFDNGSRSHLVIITPLLNRAKLSVRVYKRPPNDIIDDKDAIPTPTKYNHLFLQYTSKSPFLGENDKFARPDVGSYITWYNAHIPFRVVITPLLNRAKLSVTAYRPPLNQNRLDEDGDYNLDAPAYTVEVAKYIADKVFIGEGDIFEGPISTIGNTFLVNISFKENTYAFIGDVIYTFRTEQYIHTFWSPIGGSNYPDPCASTQTCVYILTETNLTQKYIPTITWNFINKHMPNTKPNLSNFYHNYHKCKKAPLEIETQPCIVTHERILI